MTENWYMAMRLMRELETYGTPAARIQVDDNPDGLIGMIPVFSSREAARKVYGNDVDLLVIQPGPSSHENRSQQEK